MTELVYSSRTPINLTKTDFSTIQTISEDANLKIGVTGCLFFHDKQFVGILEGKEEAVKKLFVRIRKDQRHDKIVLLARGPIGKRQFSNWNMISCMKGTDLPSYINYRLCVKNILSLVELVEKHTNGSEMFWHTVKENLQDIDIKRKGKIGL